MKILCRIFGHKWRSPEKPFTKCLRCQIRKEPNMVQIEGFYRGFLFTQITGYNRKDKRRNNKKEKQQ